MIHRVDVVMDQVLVWAVLGTPFYFCYKIGAFLFG
jgi:hypothetical protein